MTRFLFPLWIYVVTVSFLLLYTSCNDHKNDNHQFEKSGEVVLNPGQGWVFYGVPSGQNDATLALGTTGYNRLDWTVLNPQENVYNWAQIDNTINAYAKLGKQFAFGIMSVNTPGNAYCTPKWVFDKGAKYTTVAGNIVGDNSGKTYYIPVWDDPVYVAECEKFAEALAKKYDGNPNIAFIDIRNYGNWGEMHLYPFNQYSKAITDEQIKELLIRPYLDNFKKTQLVICASGLNNWAINNSIGLRLDGIMGDRNTTGHSGNGDVISMAIGKQPIVWEILGSYKILENNWSDKRFLDNIKTNKPNYISLGGWGSEAQYMLSKKPDLVREVANLMGFNFSMTFASYNKIISPGQPVEIALSIENSGVTNMLTGCVVKLVILDSNNNLVSSFTTDWNLNTIQGDMTSDFTANVVFVNVPEGTYQLAIGLYSTENDHKPVYNLDNKKRTSDGFYIIGSLKIK